MLHRHGWILIAPLALMLPAAPAPAQDAHILLPVDTIERRLRQDVFDIVDIRPSRGLEGERTARATLTFGDGAVMAVKWAPAARKAEAFNNSPRYEVAAYELQKLFLDEPDFVVPPTVLRAVPLTWHRRVDEEIGATFPDTESVLVTIQYWLFNVTGGDVWDEDRFDSDSAYARHVGNLNVLTYLIRHNDANEGNFLISRTEDNPRVFSVDNGLAFDSEASDRGTAWRRLRVDRLAAGTVARLRALTEDDLARQLGTVAQFTVRDDGQLETGAVTGNLDHDRGIRRRDDAIQLGLTRGEIRGVWRRLQYVLREVERGEIEVY